MAKSPKVPVIARSAERFRRTPDSDSDTAYVELEKTRLELDKAKAELEVAQEDLENKKQDRNLRKKYADRIFWFLVVYSAFCALVLLAQGTPTNSFKLATEIVVVLIGSTAVAVIGLVGWIVKGLFKALGD